MKILTLYFKNINSLDGESRIDFTQNPLATAGVFAIVGPNGSGKTSILDAICLALYGETFRFDRPIEQVMTSHSSESFAQVEFAVGNEKFKTRWQVSRMGTESPVPQMQLFALTEEGEQLLNETAHEVCAKIVEITGMDFRNFSRSILLAQGDFAAFLTALDSERMDILEKMSGADIYEQHKLQLQQTYQKIQADIVQTQEELTLLPLLDAVKLEAGEHDLADFQDQVLDFKQQKNHCQELLAWAQTVADLENQLVELTKNRQQTQQQISQKQTALEKISTVQGAIVFKEHVNVLEQLQQQLEQSNKTGNAYKLELNQLKNKLTAAGLANAAVPHQSVAEQKGVIDELKYQLSQAKLELSAQTSLQLALSKQLNEKQTLQTTTLRWLENHVADKSLLLQMPDTAKLIQFRAELVELDAQHQLSSRKFKVSDSSLKKNTTSIEQARKAIADYQEQLLYAEGDVAVTLENHTATDLEILLVEQQQRVADFNELYALAKVYQKINSTGLWRFLSRFTEKNEEVDVAQLKRLQEDLTEQIAQAKNIQLTLEQAVLNEVLIQRLRHERPHLVDGKPCPLCGALQHPYAVLPPKAADSRQALTNQKVHLQELQTQADKVAKQILAIEKQATNEVDKGRQFQKIRAEFVTLGNKLNVGSREFGIENLSGLKQRLQDEQAELTGIKNLLKRYGSQQDKITRLQLVLEKEQENLKQLEIVRGQLTGDTHGLPQELLEIESQLSQYQAEELALAEQVEGQLRSLGEPMPDKDKQAALLERLAMRKADYQTHLLRDKALTEELAPILEKVAANQARVEHFQTQVDKLIEKLTAEEAIGLQLAVREKQLIIESHAQLQADLQQQWQLAQEDFTAKLTGSSFTTLKEVQEALALLATESSLVTQLQALENQYDRLAQALDKTQAQLDAEQVINLTPLSVEQLTAQQRGVTEKLAIASEEVRHLDELLRRQVDLQVKQQLLTARLQQQQQQFAQAEQQWQISQENGIAFRRQVQLAMIERLLTQTNRVLEKISGRYYLRQLPTEQGLALEIEDTQQQNIRRLPQSLSGGESFLLSLGLALGLSELANNGKAVDSLFLDEGFGNLDPESLNTVINTLQGLRYHGKTVGVISHVEAVKKRIKTRIEMVKKPNGLSQLKKVS